MLRSELQQDFDFIESEADKAYNKYVTEGDNVVIKLDGEEFAGLHEVIRRRVIYRAVYVILQKLPRIYIRYMSMLLMHLLERQLAAVLIYVMAYVL